MNREGRRVVVTGMGMATPVGLDVKSSWEALREGRGGVGPVTLFDAGAFATRIAAELKGFALRETSGDDASRWEHHGRNTKIALAVATQAVRDSGPPRWQGNRPHEIRRLPRFGRGAGRTSPGSSTSSTDRSTADRSTRVASPPRESSVSTPLLEAEQEPGTPGRPPRGRLRGEGSEPLVPDGLRGQRPGDWRGGRADPRRRRRCHARRRRAQHDPSVRAHGVHSLDRDVDAQR